MTLNRLCHTLKYECQLFLSCSSLLSSIFPSLFSSFTDFQKFLSLCSIFHFPLENCVYYLLSSYIKIKRFCIGFHWKIDRIVFFANLLFLRWFAAFLYKVLAHYFVPILRYIILSFFIFCTFLLALFFFPSFDTLRPAQISLQVVGQLSSFRNKSLKRRNASRAILRKQEDFLVLIVCSIIAVSKVSFVRLRHSIKKTFSDRWIFYNIIFFLFK